MPRIFAYIPVGTMPKYSEKTLVRVGYRRGEQKKFLEDVFRGLERPAHVLVDVDAPMKDPCGVCFALMEVLQSNRSWVDAAGKRQQFVWSSTAANSDFMQARDIGDKWFVTKFKREYLEKTLKQIVASLLPATEEM